MDAARFELRPADERDIPYVEALLEAEGLPTADLRSTPARFSVGYRGDEPVGVGGLEVHGDAALLRSVVVERAARGAGPGTALCDALEAAAASAGVGSLYLLTETAAGFFERRGYVEVERTVAPTAIRRTTQFAEHCPSTATCMRRRP